MRPKVALLVLVTGLGLLALFVVFRGLSSKNVPGPESGAGEGAGQEAANLNPSNAAPSKSNASKGSVVATTPAEDMAAQKQQDLEAIQNAFITGSSDPKTIATIGDRLFSPDAEVRAAARTAATHLDDTNMLPYLNTALEQTQDPREKVALLDAVEYLNLAAATELSTTNGMSPRALSELPVNQVQRTNSLRKRPPGAGVMPPRRAPANPAGTPQ